MKKPLAVALSALFVAGVVLAQGHPANFARPVDFPARTTEPAKKAEAGKCEAKAVGKDGKPLSGDAKTAFIKKCEADAKAAK